MKIPTQIVFRNVSPSDAVTDAIHRKVEALEIIAGELTSCRVTVELPHRHKHRGNHFRVRIVAIRRGQEIIVDREPAASQSHQDVYAAIHDAFEAAERKAKASDRASFRRFHLRRQKAAELKATLRDRETEAGQLFYAGARR